MKLFAVYIGGEFEGANIELHDMRFVVAPSIVDTYEELRHQWWGVAKSLHIDCWAEIDHADGHDVSLSTQPFAGAKKLYYVNLGGYDPSEFIEKHRNVFVVAENVAQAKGRAIKLAGAWTLPHRDEMYEAEQAFSLHDSGRKQRLYLHLTPSNRSSPPAFTCAYTPIGKAAAKSGVAERRA
jgi:hypothetical protein